MEAIHHHHETKGALGSKKFLAWLISEVLYKVLTNAIIGGIFYFQKELTLMWTVVILSLVFSNGFITVGFILGQAVLDKYVRLASITGALIQKPLESIKQLGSDGPEKPDFETNAPDKILPIVYSLNDEDDYDNDPDDEDLGNEEET